MNIRKVTFDTYIYTSTTVQ